MDAHANRRDFFAINPDEAWRFLQAFDPTTTFWEFQAYDDNKTRGENGVKLYGTFQKKWPRVVAPVGFEEPDRLRAIVLDWGHVATTKQNARLAVAVPS